MICSVIVRHDDVLSRSSVSVRTYTISKPPPRMTSPGRPGMPGSCEDSMFLSKVISRLHPSPVDVDTETLGPLSSSPTSRPALNPMVVSFVVPLDPSGTLRGTLRAPAALAAPLVALFKFHEKESDNNRLLRLFPVSISMAPPIIGPKPEIIASLFVFTSILAPQPPLVDQPSPTLPLNALLSSTTVFTVVPFAMDAYELPPGGSCTTE